MKLIKEVTLNVVGTNNKDIELKVGETLKIIKDNGHTITVKGVK